MNKRGEAIGEWVVMIYHLLLVSLIAFIVLGVSGVFYAHEINIRETESILMARQMIDCLTLGEELTQERFNQIKENGLFTYCDIRGSELDRFFVRIKLEEDKKEIGIIEQGDSGSLWIKEIFLKGRAGSESSTKLYTPGYYLGKYPTYFDKRELNLTIEVLSKHE